jgi:hypothetical protein
MMPGESLDCQDILFRPDGALYKHWGWRRINATALSGRIIAQKGFAYKGKNSPAAYTARPGNFGIANDGSDYTRRTAFYTSAVVLTDTELRFWNPSTQTLDLPADRYPVAGPFTTWIPTGTTIAADPKPSLVVFQNNVYIFGWADQNLRWDPTDRQLYIVGWDVVPTNAGHTGAGGAGGTLVTGATYRYRVSFYDIYTGEESELSAEFSDTPAAGETRLPLVKPLRWIT